MAVMPVMRRGPKWVLAGFVALGLSCGGPQGTEPDSSPPAFAKSGSSPTVTSTDPSGAPQDTTLDVHVFGSGFDRGSSVAFARNGVVDSKLHVNGTSLRTSSELVANLTVAADAETVPYDVVVTTSTGKKGIGTELFVIEVPLEVLESPSGSSNVSGVGATGLIVGTIGTSCGPGFAPALWDQDGHVTALPALAGTCGGTARAVNGSGVAVGSAYIGSTSAASVRWTPVAGAYAVDQLPPLPNGTDPGPWDINASGSITSGNAPAVWTQATGWQLLTKPSGATGCFATTLNDLDQMAAQCTIGGNSQAVFWSSSAALPVVLPLPSGAIRAYVWGINSSGIVAGFVMQSDGRNRAVRWVPSGSTWGTQILPDLGYGGAAHGLNDGGQVVGSAGTKSGSARPAFWEASGALHLLESADGVGEAVGISEPDVGPVIAGYVRVGKNGGSRIAVRWRP